MIKQYKLILMILIFFNETTYSQFFSSERIFEVCADAVVYIENKSGIIGAGFFINEDGYIITNHHVVQDGYGNTVSASRIRVKTKYGYAYDVVSIDITPDFYGLDIAILKINQKISNYLPLKSTDAIVGEEVVAIGHPAGDSWNQSAGTISKIRTADNYLIQHHVPTDEGNSGGPLINAKGQVVAVVTGYKKMFDNYGNLKTQETGKLATKISYVINALDRRNIKYYTDPIVFEGMTEYERQFVNLKNDQKKLQEDRIQLIKEKEDFENYKKNENEKIALEKKVLNQERIELESKRQESRGIIEKADIIKNEIENGKKSNERKWQELVNREQEIERKENWIREKEVDINKQLTNRFAFELLINPTYMYNQNIDNHFSNFRGSIGLFYRFGFLRNNYGVVTTSDRIGFVYGFEKNYSYNQKKILDNYNQDLSLAMEFNDLMRIGLGKSFQNEYKYFGYKEYNFAYIMLNLTGYPIPFGFSFTFYTDNKFSLKNYSIGLYTGFNLTFLRL